MLNARITDGKDHPPTVTGYEDLHGFRINTAEIFCGCPGKFFPDFSRIFPGHGKRNPEHRCAGFFWRMLSRKSRKIFTVFPGKKISLRFPGASRADEPKDPERPCGDTGT